MILYTEYTMKKILVLLLLLWSPHTWANDGAYYASGNHLIPLQETTISVSKEILRLTEVGGMMQVEVYYEFDNPGPAKTLTVGFEASAPDGDIDQYVKHNTHPYIHNFTVKLNDEWLEYNSAATSVSAYSLSDLRPELGKTYEPYEVDLVVYYFDAHFEKGRNILTHTYSFDLSGSVDARYSFDYVLTAANRWANKQIDDFTLLIDMGPIEEFCVSKEFFSDASEWEIKGRGKAIDDAGMYGSEKNVLFYIQDAYLKFYKKNFKPQGELYLYSEPNFKSDELPFTPFNYFTEEMESQYSPKVLRNLPFARRGYVFRDPHLREVFAKQSWYMPDPDYVPELETLPLVEYVWYKKYEE